jgi:hypothetical protein
VHDNALDELVNELEEAHAVVALFLDQQKVAERIEKVGASLGTLCALQERTEHLLWRLEGVQLQTILLRR